MKETLQYLTTNPLIGYERLTKIKIQPTIKHYYKRHQDIDNFIKYSLSDYIKIKNEYYRYKTEVENLEQRIQQEINPQIKLSLEQELKQLNKNLTKAQTNFVHWTKIRQNSAPNINLSFSGFFSKNKPGIYRLKEGYQNPRNIGGKMSRLFGTKKVIPPVVGDVTIDMTDNYSWNSILFDIINAKRNMRKGKNWRIELGELMEFIYDDILTQSPLSVKSKELLTKDNATFILHTCRGMYNYGTEIVSVKKTPLEYISNPRYWHTLYKRQRDVIRDPLHPSNVSKLQVDPELLVNLRQISHEAQTEKLPTDTPKLFSQDSSSDDEFVVVGSQ